MLTFGDLDVGIEAENATCYPAPGHILLYPVESARPILFPYGSASFASKAGALAGNHFATVVEGLDGLRELGRRALWEGAQPIEFVER